MVSQLVSDVLHWRNRAPPHEIFLSTEDVALVQSSRLVRFLSVFGYRLVKLGCDSCSCAVLASSTLQPEYTRAWLGNEGQVPPCISSTKLRETWRMRGAAPPCLVHALRTPSGFHTPSTGFLHAARAPSTRLPHALPHALPVPHACGLAYGRLRSAFWDQPCTKNRNQSRGWEMFKKMFKNGKKMFRIDENLPEKNTCDVYDV